jgi:hypothetical protein
MLGSLASADFGQRDSRDVPTERLGKGYLNCLGAHLRAVRAVQTQPQRSDKPE